MPVLIDDPSEREPYSKGLSRSVKFYGTEVEIQKIKKRVQEAARGEGIKMNDGSALGVEEEQIYIGVEFRPGTPVEQTVNDLVNGIRREFPGIMVDDFLVDEKPSE